MAEIKITLTSPSGTEIYFENLDILSWSTTTTCTSDASSPIFDAFPNSGQVVLKDIELSLYEKAIAGAFDEDYNFDVDIYVDNEKIAHHIVNQQPYYNYEDKTLTLNLGNELDITSDLIYEGYEYPLQDQTLYIVWLRIIPNLFSITEEEARDIIRKTYGQSIGDTQGEYYNQSFYAYFNTIKIEYPYLSSKPQREVLKNLLTLAKCCLYQDENKKLVLVRMDGGFEQSVDYGVEPLPSLYDNVNFVLPDQTNKGFVPSIIQKNNYNVAEISCNKVDQKTNNGSYYKKEGTVPSGNIFNEIAKTEWEHSPLAGINFYNIDGEKNITLTGVTTAYLTGKIITSENKNYATFDIKVSLFQKNNLIKALEPINKENVLFSLTKGQITKKITKGTLYLASDPSTGETVAYSYSPLQEIEETTTTVLAYSPPKTIVYNDLSLSFNNILEENSLIFFDNDKEFTYSSTKLVGCEYKYFNFENAEIKTPTSINSAYAWLENVTCEEITLIPLNASFSFNGDYSEIEFNGQTLTVPADVTPPHKMTVSTGGGLMQYTNEITETSFPVQYGLDLLGWFNGGIKTGELTVIKDQYTNNNGDVIVGKENHKIFKVGDLIVPCKDYNYTPIMSNADGSAIIYKVVEAETFGEGGAVFQNLKVRQVKAKKAQELPYYLVANDTGISIYIRENGYATEGDNNQIIQIAWQT